MHLRVREMVVQRLDDAVEQMQRRCVNDRNEESFSSLAVPTRHTERL